MKEKICELDDLKEECDSKNNCDLDDLQRALYALLKQLLELEKMNARYPQACGSLNNVQIFCIEKTILFHKNRSMLSINERIKIHGTRNEHDSNTWDFHHFKLSVPGSITAAGEWHAAQDNG